MWCSNRLQNCEDNTIESRYVDISLIYEPINNII